MISRRGRELRAQSGHYADLSPRHLRKSLCPWLTFSWDTRIWLNEIWVTGICSNCFWPSIPARKYFYPFSSVAQLCPTLCDPMDYCTPGFPVHHQLPELAQIHVHRVSDIIQPSHLMLSPFYCPDYTVYWASLVSQMVKNLPVMQETRVWSLDWEDALKEEMATHSSILSWRISMDRGA